MQQETCRIGNRLYSATRTIEKGKVVITISENIKDIPLSILRLNPNEVRVKYKNLSYYLSQYPPEFD